MIEGFLVGDGEEEDARNVEIWRPLAGKMINAMPDDIRIPLMSRDRIRRDFDLPEHGMMGVEPYDFDEMSFWCAMANATTTKSRTLATMTGETGEVTLVDGDGGRALTIAIGGTTLSVDAWPWRSRARIPRSGQRPLSSARTRSIYQRPTLWRSPTCSSNCPRRNAAGTCLV